MTTNHPIVRTFEWNNASYEIRIAKDAQGARVRAFKGGIPANNLSYSVRWELAADYGNSDAAVEALVDVAKNDVKHGHGLPPQ